MGPGLLETMLRLWVEENSLLRFDRLSLIPALPLFDLRGELFDPSDALI